MGSQHLQTPEVRGPRPTGVRRHYRGGGLDFFSYATAASLDGLLASAKRHGKVTAVEVKFSDGQLVTYRLPPCEIIRFQRKRPEVSPGP